MRTWNAAYDKEVQWGGGPWVGEPDRVQWVDEETGFHCLILRNKHGGTLLGYVGVGPEHPWYQARHYECMQDGDGDCEDGWCDHSPVNLISVHGRLAFSGWSATHSESAWVRELSEGGCLTFSEWLEREALDTVCLIPATDDEIRWFGFDCAHSEDLIPYLPELGGTYRPVGFVEAEVMALATQLKDVEK